MLLGTFLGPEHNIPVALVLRTPYRADHNADGHEGDDGADIDDDDDDLAVDVGTPGAAETKTRTKLRSAIKSMTLERVRAQVALASPPSKSSPLQGRGFHSPRRRKPLGSGVATDSPGSGKANIPRGLLGFRGVAKGLGTAHKMFRKPPAAATGTANSPSTKTTTDPPTPGGSPALPAGDDEDDAPAPTPAPMRLEVVPE